jgi:hypothetical protein
MKSENKDSLTIEEEIEIYKLAEEKLRYGWDEAKKICFTFKNDKTISECYYNLILLFLRYYPSALKYNLEQLEKTCRDMPDYSWKGECYFLLADYSPIDVKQAARLCNLSQLMRLCYYHVALTIGFNYDSTKTFSTTDITNNNFGPKKRALEFCKLTEEPYIQNCYMSFGVIMAWWLAPNIELSLKECGKLDEFYRNSCYFGVSEHIGTDYSRNITLISHLCNKMNGEYKIDCYYKLGFSIGKRYLYNSSLAFEMCNKVKKEYIIVCLNGVQSYINSTPIIHKFNTI